MLYCKRCHGRVEEVNAIYVNGEGPYGRVCAKRVKMIEKEKQKNSVLSLGFRMEEKEDAL